MVYFAQQALNALQLGSIYALIALGYTMVYGVLVMINFAHGDIFMMGAFTCLVAALFLKLPFAGALVFTMGITALMGMAVERIAYRPLRNAPRMSAVITALGVGLFLENATLAISPYPQRVPALLKNTTWNFGGLAVSSVQMVIVGLSIALMIALDLLVRRSLWGLAMRAISWDRDIVPLMGVPVARVVSTTFAIGGGLGGAAGVMYAMAYPVIDPSMGILVGWKAFISAVVGGIGNIRGAMLGGFILGGTEIFVAAFLPSTYRDFVGFTLLLCLLIVRPHGILGTPSLEKV
ncbi:MAG: branched-chain amino acid ABC transporter permease [Thermoanaerobaculia bacterium]